jgi:CheY-like chemotaxis protein
VAKILVADDNSNVQKTVALALADLGVEVVGVNNGEAAVRKLGEMMPDIVLADIFMPVRNGYEVCEYVKKDSRFSHMPVVLLVGAFDPLDEREAQRVGADGILKKPFVPPDPLIAMVKTLLDRMAGERLVTSAVSKSAVSKQSKGGGVAVADEPHSTPQTFEEPQEEQLRAPAERFSFGNGERPMAFSQLLDSPAIEVAPAGTGVAEEIENEQVLTSSRDSALGEPIFWKAEEPEAEADAEKSETEEDVSSETSARAWQGSEIDIQPSSASGSVEAIEPLELIRDDNEEASQPSTIVASTPLIVHDSASQASLNVEASKPEDLAANPIDWMNSVAPALKEEIPPADPELSVALIEPEEPIAAKESEIFKSSLAIPVSAAPPEAPSAAPTPAPPVLPHTPAADVSNAVASKDPVKTQPVIKPVEQSVNDTARSLPAHDWTDLAASLLPKAVEPVAEKIKPSPSLAAEQVALPEANVQPAPSNPAPNASKPVSQSVIDTAKAIPKLDWAELAASLQPKAVESGAEKSKLEAASPFKESAANAVGNQPEQANSEQAGDSLESSAANATPDPALVEAVVQRVLEKMRPQVVDIITREFLRPVVQALVHREINKK